MLHMQWPVLARKMLLLLLLLLLYLYYLSKLAQ